MAFKLTESQKEELRVYQLSLEKIIRLDHPLYGKYKETWNQILKKKLL